MHVLHRHDWYGMMYSFADSKKKSNLMLSIFEPGNVMQISLLYEQVVIHWLVCMFKLFLMLNILNDCLLRATCWLRGCKNRPAVFPRWMSYKATKPGYHILACYIIVFWFIRAHFYVLLVFVAVCFVFWLFWLTCQYLPSDWLERPLWGSLTVARESSP